MSRLERYIEEDGEAANEGNSITDIVSFSHEETFLFKFKSVLISCLYVIIAITVEFGLINLISELLKQQQCDTTSLVSRMQFSAFFKFTAINCFNLFRILWRD